MKIQVMVVILCHLFIKTFSLEEIKSDKPYDPMTVGPDAGITVQGLTASWSMDINRPTLSNVSFEVDQVIHRGKRAGGRRERENQRDQHVLI